MYLIRQLSTHNGHLDITSGLEIVCLSANSSKRFHIFNSFWGTAQISIGKLADISHFEKIGYNFYLLPYANNFAVSGANDFFKNISIHADRYEPENIEGYLLFIRNEQKISTNGKKLYFGYPNKIIVLLKDGEFLEFSGKRVKVEQNILSIEV